MDLDKAFKFLAENLADWLRVTLLTLSRPVSRFELVSIPTEPLHVTSGAAVAERPLWLNPKLIAFSLLSIALGITMNSLLPNRLAGPELLSSLIILLCLWVVYGSLLHIALSSAKGGRAISGDT